VPDVAIVTGGAGSIGRATGARLAQDGFTVLLADINEPVESIPGCLAARLDVRSAESIAELFRYAATLGTVSAVVNTHGILHETPVDTFNEEQIESIIAINLTGTARMAHAAGEHLANDGSLIFVSSVTASIGRAHGGYAYLATKGGIESLTRAFAVALGERGIRVNCVAPGFVSVPMQGTGADSREKRGGTAALLPFTPLKRLVTPAEVADAIGFLCSRQASGITGVVLPVDAGQRAF
jgi:NAD(P)-dependent dehydrogenase (short-subunit alcohol dehydrogenase family)